MDSNVKRELACKINGVIMVKRPETLEPKVDPKMVFAWLEEIYHVDIVQFAIDYGYENLIEMLMKVDSVMVVWDNDCPLVTYSRRYMTSQQNQALTAKRAKTIAKEKQNKGKRFPAQPRDPNVLIQAAYSGHSTKRSCNNGNVNSPEYKEYDLTKFLPMNESEHETIVPTTNWMEKSYYDSSDVSAVEESKVITFPSWNSFDSEIPGPPEYYRGYNDKSGLRYKGFLKPSPIILQKNEQNVDSQKELHSAIEVDRDFHFPLVDPQIAVFQCEDHVITIYSEEEYLKSTKQLKEEMNKTKTGK